MLEPTFRRRHLRRTHPVRRRQGFTFIEVVAALLIFTAAVGSVIQLGTTVQRGLGRLTVNSMAHRLARERADSLRDVAYASLVPGTLVETVGQGRDTCKVTIRVTQWNGRLRRVEVTAMPLTRPGAEAFLTTYSLDPW